MAPKTENIYYLAHSRKSLPIPALKGQVLEFLSLSFLIWTNGNNINCRLDEGNQYGTMHG